MRRLFVAGRGGDGGLLGGDRLGDGGRALDLGDPRLAQGVQVAVLVADVAIVKESIPSPMLARSPAEISCTFWANWSGLM
jgi:hypothetical protein